MDWVYGVWFDGSGSLGDYVVVGDVNGLGPSLHVEAEKERDAKQVALRGLGGTDRRGDSCS